MLILVINCGSSSVKYNLFDIVQTSSNLCKGMVERIGESPSLFKHEAGRKSRLQEEVQCPDHYKAVEIIKDALTDSKKGVLTDVGEVSGIGHRVVHGGEEFSESTLIDEKILKSIEEFSELAPLHNPPSSEGIKSCKKLFQGTPQVAVFDTAFHQSMAEHVFCYGIPYKFYEKYRIRKYGFHGTSHRYVSRKTAELLKRPIEDLNLITVHLGNGCSIAAVQAGKSIDTSMGFTPLEGLLMGTRSGDLDPAVVTFLMRRVGLGAGQIDEILNKKSGLLGVSGISNDMRDILAAIGRGNKRARLAYDIFVYRIKKYIGSYAAILGKVDAIVFTAGIGEHVSGIKDQIRRELKPLLGDKTEFLAVGTNEELLIAEDTYRIIGGETYAESKT